MIFAPIHIIFLELICDPASVLGFEKERAMHNLMQGPPRPTSEPLINPRLWLKIILQGLSITAICFFFYYHFAITHGNTELGRTAALVALVLSQTFLILISREWEQIKSNKLLLTISGIIILVLAGMIFIPILQNIFKLVPLTAKEIFYIILGTFVVALLNKIILKLLPARK